MHGVNCSIFFSAFLKAPWISDKHKARLLEWKGRNDLALYASRRCPKPLLDEIQNYKPVKPQQSSWNAVIERMMSHQDDGHGIKLVRALRHGEEICKPYDGKPSFKIRNGMWEKLGNMGKYRIISIDPSRYLMGHSLLTISVAIDSVENSGDSWVHSAGFNEAWEKWVLDPADSRSCSTNDNRFEDRPRAQL